MTETMAEMVKKTLDSRQTGFCEVEAGWALLAAGERVKADPARPGYGGNGLYGDVEAWRLSSWTSGSGKSLAFLDWFACLVYRAGLSNPTWEGAVSAAFHAADAALHLIPLGEDFHAWPCIFDGYSLGKLRDRLQEILPEARPPSEHPASALWALLAHPKFLESSRHARERYDRFQASLREGE